MPLLSYSAITDYPFQSFTKIYSADINLMFSTIQTLLNVTKLDQTNVQAHGLTRYTSASALAAGTANYAVYNDSNGDLTEAAQLPATVVVSGSPQAGQYVAVGPTGTLLIGAPSPGAASAIFNYYNFS